MSLLEKLAAIRTEVELTLVGAGGVYLMFKRWAPAIAFGKKAWAWCGMFLGGAAKVLERLDRQDDALRWIKTELQGDGGVSLRQRANETYAIVLRGDMRTRTIVNSWPTGMAECDEQGLLLWSNRALALILGLESQELLGHGWMRAVEESDLRRSEEEWRRATEKDYSYTWDFRAVHQQTRERFRVRVTVAGLRVAGRTHGFQVVFEKLPALPPPARSGGGGGELEEMAH